MATASPRPPPPSTALTVSSASVLRLRYPTATSHPARASSCAVARPMPRPPPVTKARFPERSITTPHPIRNAECGMWNGNARSLASRPPLLHSAFRISHSALSNQLCLHDPTDDMLDRELQLLDVRGFIGRYHETVVDQSPHRAPALAEQRDHADALGARGLRRPHQVGALAAGRVQHEQISRSYQRLHLPREDRLEPEIVGARGEQRRVGGQRDRRQGPPVLSVADH